MCKFIIDQARCDDNINFNIRSFLILISVTLSLSKIETPSEPPPTLFDAQMMTVNSQKTPEGQDQSPSIVKPEKPAHWNQISATEKSNWTVRLN